MHVGFWQIVKVNKTVQEIGASAITANESWIVKLWTLE